MGSLTVTKDAEPGLNIDGNMISFEQFKEEMLSQNKPQKEDMICVLENKLKKYESNWSILYRGYCLLTGKKNDSFAICKPGYPRSGCAIRNGAVASFLLLFCLTSCAGPRQQIPSPPPSQEFYLQSQQKLALGNCEEAYYDYQKAVAVEPGLANATYLSNILYSWVLKQSEEADTPLLNAQKQVLLAPQQSSPRQELLSIAVDRDKDTISAFGLGLIPSNISHPGQKRLLAREAALTDSYAWVGRLAKWARKDVKGSLDISQTVVGVEVIKEFWVADTIYVIKIKSSLSKNLPE